MIKKKIELNYTNNLSDKPNNFIRMCYKLCKQYKLEISSIKEFNSSYRNFYVELVGSDIYIKISLDYEYSYLEYEIIASNEFFEKAIDNYIFIGTTKVNYEKGDTVYDIYGNKYTVMIKTNIPLSENGARKLYKVLLQNESGENIELVDVMISPI